MRTLKILSFIFALLFILPLAVSCSGGNEKKEYKTDVSVETLYKNVEQAVVLEKNDLSFRDVGELGLSMAPGIGDVVSDGKAEFTVRNTGNYSCDEYGVFRFSSQAEAEAAKAGFDAYLKAKKEDTTMRSYFGEEAYKYDESEVKVYGSYVVFAIMSKTNRKAVFDTVLHLIEK